MKKIESDEIFRNLHEFLKGKGIELTQGSYSSAVQKTCAVLTDTVNLSQEGFEKVRTGVEKKLDQVRRVIHEKTAPRKAQPAAAGPVQEPPMANAPAPAPNPPKAPVVSRRPKPTPKRKVAGKKSRPKA